MKKTLALLLAVVLFATSVTAFGEQQDPIEAKINYLNENAEEVLFETGKPLMVYLLKPIIQVSDAETAYKSAEQRALLTCVAYRELELAVCTNEQFKELFGGEAPQLLTSEISYMGKEDNLLGFYLKTTTRDCYVLYDVSAQVMAYVFLNSNSAAIIEKELFENIFDVYEKNDTTLVEKSLGDLQESYEQLKKQLMAAQSGIPSFNDKIAMAREKDLYTKDPSLKFGHQPFLYKLDPNCEDEMILAVLFSELNTLQRIGANKELKKSLAKIDFTPDLSKPAYSGRDGDVVCAYLQGTKCGFFFIYDIASNTMTYGFVRPDAADRVEAELFQNCTGGYQTLNTDMLKNWLESTAETYSQF